ncbi:VOC family protein [Paenibacillus uliginis]|uniref:VOC family protein n=1 Tax=Paenibacillus uliginis TaxID=683737 RepID=UPI001AD82679|nr:VOC family protein [Paenibacillus uliginis]
MSEHERTLRYYGNLGFSCDESFGFVHRDGFEIIIHETKNTSDIRPNYPSHGQDALDIFSMVNGVESLYEEFKSKGAEFRYQLRITEYGMKEFAIQDPDGYSIGFGESLND